MNSLHDPGRRDRSWHNEILSHLNWLRSVVRARIEDSHAVDDLLNDVVADALAVHNPMDRIQLPAPWLYRLAVRKVLLFRRRCGRQRRAYVAQAELEKGRSHNRQSATPLEEMLDEERSEAVRFAMLQLNGQDSEILLLKYVHEWSYDTISKNLGIDYWKVVHRLRRARERLRTELIRSNIDEK